MVHGAPHRPACAREPRCQRDRRVRVDRRRRRAIGRAAPTVGLCGDLCFLHDTNGLLAAPGPATFVVIDNDGGGIFSYLPPVTLPEFEQLFGTPHGLDLVEVRAAHGAEAERIDDLGKLRVALAPDELVASGAVRVLVVPVDRYAASDAIRRSGTRSPTRCRREWRWMDAWRVEED